MQGDRTVHGPAVNIHIAQLFCKLFGQGALTATRPTVDGYNYLFCHLIPFDKPAQKYGYYLAEWPGRRGEKLKNFAPLN